MKLVKIKTIKNYKSYTNFSWAKYFNSQDLHENMNIFFGENGCGKSSITNILKSLCDEKPFDKHKPEEATLKFSDAERKYTSGTGWDSSIHKGMILFFDREFVDRNIHLGHIRGTTASEQEQESGKLIIEFDNEAIKLRNTRDKQKELRDNRQEKIAYFRKDNKVELEFSFSEEEAALYKDLSKLSEEELKKKKELLLKEKSTLDALVRGDKKNQEKISEIQEIEKIEELTIELSFSDLQSYKNVFGYPLKEQSVLNAEQTLIESIKTNKDFFNSGIQIRKTSPGKCPFCQTESEEEKIESILSTFNSMYDDSYKKSLEAFELLKNEYIAELDLIQSEIKSIKINDIFLGLKELDELYKIKGIYSVEEEKSYNKPEIKQLNSLKQRLESIQKPSFENIDDMYAGALPEYANLNKYIDKVKSLIKTKNKLIEEYKSENTDTKINKRISESNEKLEVIQKQIDFITDNKIEKKKKKDKKTAILNTLEKELKEIKDDYIFSKGEYEKYASSTAFTNLLTKIESYFEGFNFAFTLKLETDNRKTGATKEFPFAFSVLDLEGNQRDFKDGLSEGELQVLSLCFFFAFLDIQDDKANKILLFDDPISSLDNSNLSCLVELISDKHNEFSQTFILTHHRVFYKFLQKKFRTDRGEKGSEFIILRNKKEYGGSFILPSLKKELTKKLKWFRDYTIEESESQTGIDIETKIIEYGQYLRYETERFVKNTLLQWNQDNFPKLIEGVKANKTIDDKKLESLKKVYSFCNWTTSHVDVGDDHGVSQLKKHISLFLEVKEKEK